jgi:antitoxin CcdA
VRPAVTQTRRDNSHWDSSRLDDARKLCPSGWRGEVMAIQLPRRPVNVSVPIDKAAQGREIGLSATLERAIAQELRTRPRSEWLTANAAAIDAYNRDVDTHGSFGDAVRTF